MVGGLGGRAVLSSSASLGSADLGAALVRHLGLAHLASAHRSGAYLLGKLLNRSLNGGYLSEIAGYPGLTWSSEGLLDLDALEVLLVFELLLHVLVSLEEFVVLDLSLLEPLVHSGLDLLPERVHLVGLFLDQSGLGSHYLLVTLLHVALALLLFHLLGLDLDLVGLSVLLLSSELLLDLLEVKELSGLLEGEGKLLLKELPVLLKVTDVTVLESADGLLVLLLNGSKGLVPALVKVLVLHQVGLLDFVSFAGLLVDEGLASAGEVLDLQLLNAVLGHLGLDVLALGLALLAVLLQHGAKANG